MSSCRPRARRTRCLRKTNQSCARLRRKGWEVRRCQRMEDSTLCYARPGDAPPLYYAIQPKEASASRHALTLAPLAWLRSTRSTIAQHPGKPERRSLVLHWRVSKVFSALLDAGSKVYSKSRRLLKKEAMVFQLTVENSPIAHANSTTSVQNSSVQ